DHIYSGYLIDGLLIECEKEMYPTAHGEGQGRHYGKGCHRQRPGLAGRKQAWQEQTAYRCCSFHRVAPEVSAESEMMRPSLTCMSRWQRAATDSSCVTSTRARPRDTVESSSAVNTVSEVSESRAPVGSSANTTDGSAIWGRAMETRCAWPPESCPSLRLYNPSSPRSDNQLRACVSAVFRGTPESISGRAVFSWAVNSGNRRPS